MKTRTLTLIILALLALAVVIAYGQTNDVHAALAPASSVGDGVWAGLIADDVRKLVFDLLSGFSLKDLVEYVVVAYLGAKGLRNYTRLGGGPLGRMLNLLNLEGRPPDTKQAGSIKPEQPANPPAQ